MRRALGIMLPRPPDIHVGLSSDVFEVLIKIARDVISSEARDLPGWLPG
jgi:hypothetical protein